MGDDFYRAIWPVFYIPSYGIIIDDATYCPSKADPLYTTSKYDLFLREWFNPLYRLVILLYYYDVERQS